MVQKERIRALNDKPIIDGHILYFMDRDRRIHDNWALLFAQELAEKNKKELHIIYVLPSQFLESALRQHDFMIKGLQECEQECKKYGIKFFATNGDPSVEVPKYITKEKIGYLITDFTPLKLPREWRTKIAKKIDCKFYEVDTHNIVPCWQASDKKEFAAYTIRPKIKKLLPKYLVDFTKLKKCSVKSNPEKINWEQIIKSLKIDKKVEPVDWITPGETAAEKAMIEFLSKKIDHYNEQRNDPNAEALSGLSPYLHYGQISAQRIALEAKNLPPEKTESFLEELIIRKELADNFCFYCKYYDNLKGFHEWAQKTLNDHRGDQREYIYSAEEFEKAKTHDDLWNAAQQEMLQTGKMHGYMRMYWCKKILEWTDSPETAQKIAIYLNDKYELDGRDPNGYTGIAWSIGGIHDRAWTERDIFGKIRYMNYNGCKRKFKVKDYINKWLGNQLFTTSD